MKKPSLLFVACLILLAACGPVELAGAAGGGGGRTPQANDAGGAGVAGALAQGANNENANPKAPGVSFYSEPTIIIKIGGQGQMTAGLSIESLGMGNFQIEYPDELNYGESGRVDLIVAPGTVTINRTPNTRSAAAGRPAIQVIQDKIEIYPIMRADLKGGDGFVISAADDFPEKPITSTSATYWSWLINPAKSGAQELTLSISVPVKAGDQDTIYEVVPPIALRIMVIAPATATLTPLPTSTPIPSFGTQLSGSAVTLTAAGLTTMGSLAGTLLLIWAGKKNLDGRKKKKQKEAKDAAEEKIKKDLPYGKKK